MTQTYKSWHDVPPEEMARLHEDIFTLFGACTSRVDTLRTVRHFAQTARAWGVSEETIERDFEECYDLSIATVSSLAEGLDAKLVGYKSDYLIIDDPLVLDNSLYMLTCPEVVDALELSIREPTPHQGKAKKNYHLLNDQHINRRRRK